MHLAAQLTICPDRRTFRGEITAILGGRERELGLAPPAHDLTWLRGFVRRFRDEVGGILAASPADMMRRARFRHAPSPFASCGGSTARTILTSTRIDLTERNLEDVHELIHGVGKRFGMRANETDWWLATAAVVVAALRSEDEGPLRLYPAWFESEIPVEILHLF